MESAGEASNATGGAALLYEVPTSLVVLLSFFYGSISLVAVVGNALVMWVVATSKKMHTVTNYFIANLALADIIIGLFAIPFQVVIASIWLFSTTLAIPNAIALRVVRVPDEATGRDKPYCAA
ncbi:putative substance-K receptor-like, partial [Penaeus vannamei]